ncbi:hypothetical protein BGZ61DRAFT_533114 [Ilyonectria robusta]|uniref:uncharacterized protein n=1 Tax=Ilyonectria robusta TaxID=1079257 RepID=UPI001E8CF79E|nr:uncharacterized protein BGZ61DRAFT_533114 [Ilyonectria robusta]KAH8688329.1 hypothetical protein BGZ61DRAFT_533114 [Ilyonectria robusta]
MHGGSAEPAAESLAFRQDLRSVLEWNNVQAQFILPSFDVPGAYILSEAPIRLTTLQTRSPIVPQAMGNGQSGPASGDAAAEGNKKMSFFQRMQDQKKSKPLSDEDILKYTGKTRDELKTWSDTRPGVGKNQPSGKMAMGGASGLGGLAAADG